MTPVSAGFAGEQWRLTGSSLIDAAFARLVTNPEARRAEYEAASDAYHRATAVAQLAARALQHDNTTGRPPTGLAQASAVWDIEAHRALLTCRTTTVLHVVSFHEAQLSHTFRAVVIHAAETGTIDSFTAERLIPALDDAARAWTQVEGKLSALSWATEPVPRALTHAARQLLDQFAHVDLQPSDPDTQRSTLATHAIHLSTSVSIAATARDLLDHGDLRAPARAVSRLVENDPRRNDTATVSPLAIHRGMSIPLPPAARDAIGEPLEHANTATHQALHHGASLDTLHRTDHTRPRDSAQPAVRPSSIAAAPPTAGPAR